MNGLGGAWGYLEVLGLQSSALKAASSEWFVRLEAAEVSQFIPLGASSLRRGYLVYDVLE